MIEEIDTVMKFNEAFSRWFEPEYLPWWNSNSHFGLGKYDRNLTADYFRTMITKNSRNSEVLPFIKIWGYKHNGKYISAICFSCEKFHLTGKRVMSEILWAGRANKAETFLEKASLIKLLKHAEKYGEQNYFDYIRMGKVIGVHPEALDNFYLRSGYRADSMIYSKKLQK